MQVTIHAGVKLFSGVATLESPMLSQEIHQPPNLMVHKLDFDGIILWFMVGLLGGGSRHFHESLHTVNDVLK